MIAITPGIGLERHGIEPAGEVLRNPTTSQLYTHALEGGDGQLAEGGPLVVDTGRFTGRSPLDKFTVREPGSEERIWWGEVNRPLDEASFDGLRAKVADYLAAQERLYVIDAFAGADPAHRIGVRVVTASPYHALFAKTMFIRPTAEELDTHEPQALVLHAPEVEAVGADLAGHAGLGNSLDEGWGEYDVSGKGADDIAARLEQRCDAVYRIVWVGINAGVLRTRINLECLELAGVLQSLDDCIEGGGDTVVYFDVAHRGG